jgi:hypothetical protein
MYTPSSHLCRLERNAALHIPYQLYGDSRNLKSYKIFYTCSKLFFFYSKWGETESTWYCDHYSPIVPAPDCRWGWLWSNWWNEDWQGKPKYSEKTSPSAILSTTNTTWTDPNLNLGCRGGKPTTNCLSYGVALQWVKKWSLQSRKNSLNDSVAVTAFP